MSSQREILLKQLQRRGNANSGYDNFVKQETMTREAILHQIQEQKKKDDIIIEQDFVPIEDRRKGKRSADRAFLSLSEMVEGLEDGNVARVTSNAKRLKDLISSNEMDGATLNKVNKAIIRVQKIADDSGFDSDDLKELEKATTEIKDLSRSRQIPREEIERLIATMNPDRVDEIYDVYNGMDDEDDRAMTDFSILLNYVSRETGENLEELTPRQQKIKLRDYIQSQQSEPVSFISRNAQNIKDFDTQLTMIHKNLEDVFKSISVADAERLLTDEGVALPEVTAETSDESYLSRMEMVFGEYLASKLPYDFDKPNTQAVDESRQLTSQGEVVDKVRQTMEARIANDIEQRERSYILGRFRSEAEEELRQFEIKRAKMKGPKKGPFTSVIRVLSDALASGSTVTIPGNATSASKAILTELNQLLVPTDDDKVELSDEDIDRYNEMAIKMYKDGMKGIRKVRRNLDTGMLFDFPSAPSAPPSAPPTTPSVAVASASSSTSGKTKKVAKDEKKSLKDIGRDIADLFGSPASASSSAPAPAPASTLNTYTGKNLKTARGKAKADGVESFMWKGRKYITNVEASVKGNTTEHKKRLIREFLN